jgi:hypothetical protein
LFGLQLCVIRFELTADSGVGTPSITSAVLQKRDPHTQAAVSAAGVARAWCIAAAAMLGKERWEGSAHCWPRPVLLGTRMKVVNTHAKQTQQSRTRQKGMSNDGACATCYLSTSEGGIDSATRRASLLRRPFAALVLLLAAGHVPGQHAAQGMQARCMSQLGAHAVPVAWVAAAQEECHLPPMQLHAWQTGGSAHARSPRPQMKSPRLTGAEVSMGVHCAHSVDNQVGIDQCLLVKVEMKSRATPTHSLTKMAATPQRPWPSQHGRRSRRHHGPGWHSTRMSARTPPPPARQTNMHSTVIWGRRRVCAVGQLGTRRQPPPHARLNPRPRSLIPSRCEVPPSGTKNAPNPAGLARRQAAGSGRAAVPRPAVPAVCYKECGRRATPRSCRAPINAGGLAADTTALVRREGWATARGLPVSVAGAPAGCRVWVSTHRGAHADVQCSVGPA